MATSKHPQVPYATFFRYPICRVSKYFHQVGLQKAPPRYYLLSGQTLLRCFKAILWWSGVKKSRSVCQEGWWAWSSGNRVLIKEQCVCLHAGIREVRGVQAARSTHAPASHTRSGARWWSQLWSEWAQVQGGTLPQELIWWQSSSPWWKPPGLRALLCVQ